MKKVLSIILALSLIMLIGSPAPFSATESATAKLYNVYGDNMLFQQKKDAVLAGTGNPGSKIECALKDSSGAVKAEAASTVDADGTFKVSFTAPEGSYDEYSIELKADGAVFETLDNVVFGELWLSSGQSNMQLELRHSSTGIEMIKNKTRGSKNVRYFYSAPNPDYDGDANKLPLNPQKEIPGCCWFDGTDDRIFNMTGVGYFFAEKLQQELDMPVGLLSGSLGGSSIRAWLPREYAEKDKAVIKALGSDYYTVKQWDEDGGYSPMGTAFGMYNKKIAPLSNFRPAGMIWYQGESDASWDKGKYSMLFDLLQDSYTEIFDYQGGDIPIVYTGLCDFSFGDLSSFKRITAEFGEMQASRPESRSVVSLSDIPLTFNVATQSVHPIEKKPVGERMTYAAQSLVYGADKCVSSPVIKNSEIKDGSIYITFSYCGDTLKVKGDRIYGFTICGKDGVYSPAEAEIVSADTVRVFSDSVKEPKSAMYASGLITERCNLYAYKDGEYIWPVLSTITDWDYIDNVWTDFGWTDCDTDEIWREESLVIADHYKIWEADGADVEISQNSALKGTGGLKITPSDSAFSVSPVTVYTDENGEVQYFQEFNKNWMNFKTMTVNVRNSGNEDITLKNLKLYTDKDKWVSPVVSGSTKTSAVIPADGQWHEVTFCLNTLMFKGKLLPAAASRTYLDDVADVEFCFEGSTGEISMDEISFGTTGLPSPVIKLLGIGPVSIIFNLITTIVGFFKIIAGK